MFSYGNEKAIKLIVLFVGFAPLYKAPGVLSRATSPPASDWLWTGWKKHPLDIWSNIEQMVRREALAFEIQS